jgi:hypothetical protein
MQMTHFIVGQTGGAEDGDLLTSSNRVHDVDGGDTCLHHLSGVRTGIRVAVTSQLRQDEILSSKMSLHRHALDVQELGTEDRGTAESVVKFCHSLACSPLVDRLSTSVEHSA